MSETTIADWPATGRVDESATGVGEDPHVKISSADLSRAAWTCSIGSGLEYYDFALYSLASALVFGPLFFPKTDPQLAMIASFSTYFLGFAIRPVGGLLFGSLGDRIGRKAVLVLTVVLMGLSTTLIGFLPTYETAGFWAPAMLVALRLMQGLGAGAEQAGAAVLMTEYAPRDRRGYIASLPFMGIQVGTVLAAAIYFIVFLGVPDVGQSWLWRLPFLSSILILGAAIYMRMHLKESPTFSKLEAHRQTTDRPLANLLKYSKKSVLVGIGLRMAENGTSAIYGALAVGYIVSVMGAKPSFGPLCLVVAPTLGAVMVPLAGWLSDRHGRARVYRWFAVTQLILAFPVWWIFSLGNTTWTLAAITIALGVGTWGMLGAQSAFLPELFGARHRYIGVSCAREVSAVIGGGIAPLLGSAIIAWMISANGGAQSAGVGAWIPLAAYTAILCAITVYATYQAPETAGRDLDDPRDALNVH